MSSSYPQRCTSVTDLTTNNSQSIASFFLQSPSVSSSSDVPSLRPSHSLLSLCEPSPVPPRPPSSRVAQIIHRFESRTHQSPPPPPARSLLVKPTTTTTTRSKPQPIIVYERISTEPRSSLPLESDEDSAVHSRENESSVTLSRSSTNSDSTSSSTTKPIEPLSHGSEELHRSFSSSQVNLLDQYRRLWTSDAVRSDTNLSKALINTNLPLKYKRDSLIRLYG